MIGYQQQQFYHFQTFKHYYTDSTGVVAIKDKPPLYIFQTVITCVDTKHSRHIYNVNNGLNSYTIRSSKLSFKTLQGHHCLK